jgi:diaminohydroxyphosphoribosylaminopyrimidine deaminase/5-amino-6-(5-phosphoribosylamino)uracil reductase
LKLATSADGKVATRSGASQWITGSEARARVHEMRAAHDCVLTGIGTVLADDPELTARTHPPPSQQPLRVVLDTRARLPMTAKLIAQAQQGSVILCHGQDHSYAFAEMPPHVQTLAIPYGRDSTGGLDLRAALDALQERFSISSIMVEAGPILAGAFVRAGLVDTIVWFRAPILIGGDGLPVVAGLDVDDLAQSIHMTRTEVIPLGVDLVETYLVQTRT